MSNVFFVWTYSAGYDDDWDGWDRTWCSASLEVASCIFSSEEEALRHFKRWYAERERSWQVESSLRFGASGDDGWASIHTALTAMIENIGQNVVLLPGVPARWDRLDLHHLRVV